MSKKDKFLASAQKHLERGSLDKALADYQKAAEEDPKDTRVWLKVAELLVKRGRKEEARDVYLKTAEIYTDQGFFQRAVAVYKNLLKLTPGFVDAHFKLADLFRQLGLLSDAMQQYEMAASVYQKLGKVPEAMGAMRRIVDLNPDNVLARIKLAEAASQAGLKDEAIESFRLAAEQLKAQGRSDEFLRVAERLLTHAPSDLTFAKEVAAGYIDRGNARFALSKLQPCFNADPRDLETLALLAKAFEQLGQVAKTVSVTKEIGRIHKEAGRAAESLSAFRRALALDPSDEEAKQECQRAQQTAAKSIRPVMQAEPGASITFSEMAIPQFLLPKESSATMPALTTSSELSTASVPSFSSPQSSVGGVEIERLLSEADLFIKYNLLDRAVEHVRKVFDSEPEHVGARERLAFALVQLGRQGEAATQYALLGEQFRLSDPARSQVYTKQAAATRPTGDLADGTTETGQLPEFGMSSTETSSEVLDFEALEAEVLDDEDLVSLDGAPSSPSLNVVSLSDLASQVNARTDKVPAYKSPPVDANDWAPPTEMTSTETFDEFDRVERTSAEGFSQAALTADLEQVDFFLNEGLADEAQSLLEDLVMRCPRHPAVSERLTRLRSLEHGAVPQSPAPGTSMAKHESNPRSVVANGGQADSGTHADLGIAYKEMGLFDAAIKEFRLLSQDPQREIYALAMIGECFETKGALPDAVIHYKKALNRSNVTDKESTQIYFQLGRVFEALGDGKEALYFFEKVMRRDPNHSDVAARTARLKGGVAASPKNPLAGADSDSVNVALDVISGGSNRSRS